MSHKNDTIRIAREIGTYDLSILPYSDCCSFLLDEHPETSMSMDLIAELEQDIPIGDLMRECLAQAEIYGIRLGDIEHQKCGLYYGSGVQEASSEPVELGSS